MLRDLRCSVWLTSPHNSRGLADCTYAAHASWLMCWRYRTVLLTHTGLQHVELTAAPNVRACQQLSVVSCQLFRLSRRTKQCAVTRHVAAQYGTPIAMRPAVASFSLTANLPLLACCFGHITRCSGPAVQTAQLLVCWSGGSLHCGVAGLICMAYVSQHHTVTQQPWCQLLVCTLPRHLQEAPLLHGCKHDRCWLKFG